MSSAPTSISFTIPSHFVAGESISLRSSPSSHWGMPRHSIWDPPPESVPLKSTLISKTCRPGLLDTRLNLTDPWLSGEHEKDQNEFRLRADDELAQVQHWLGPVPRQTAAARTWGWQLPPCALPGAWRCGCGEGGVSSSCPVMRSLAGPLHTAPLSPPAPHHSQAASSASVG